MSEAEYKVLAHKVADIKKLMWLQEKVHKEDKEYMNLQKMQHNRFLMWGIGIFTSLMITVSGAMISMYSQIQSQSVQITRLDWDVTKNSEFVAKWPTGQLGVLPDDNVQNTKIESLESKVEELQGQTNKLFNVITDNFNISKIYGPLNTDD